MAKVFNIQNFSTGDGRGIRTTVFMAGCNLHCPWCHNPECFSANTEVNDEDIMKKVMHDIDFYEASGGGVTISGGEPLLRFNEAVSLMEKIKNKGINLTVDTALSVKIPDFDKLCSLTDTFLVDLKTVNEEKYKYVIGGNINLYKENLKELIKRNKEIILRIPLIPDFNTKDEDIKEMALFINEVNLPVSFHPFHKMGSSKYAKLGLDYLYKNVDLLTGDEINHIKELYFSLGVKEAEV